MTASGESNFERELYLLDWPPCQVGVFGFNVNAKKIPFLFRDARVRRNHEVLFLLSRDDAVEAGVV